MTNEQLARYARRIAALEDIAQQLQNIQFEENDNYTPYGKLYDARRHVEAAVAMLCESIRIEIKKDTP